MMTRDNLRRKVARELRELVGQYSDDHDGIYDQELLCVLGVGLGSSDDSVDPADVYRLAELIDRPTCRDLSERSGEFASDVFTCSACGNEIATWDGAGGWLDVRYCPFCGRRVVHAND